MTINIPNFKNIELKNIVCDYNGTIAKDGKLLENVSHLFNKLSKDFKLYVITADTFGSVKEELKHLDIEVIVLKTTNHTQEKCDFVKSLDNESCIAIGNGNNDALMLQNTAISIAVIGFEGCATKAMLNSDIVVNNIEDALSLLLNPNRLIATLRK
ncbi:MAG: haloacid dehalogenase [Arcobacteraceae bacterium]|nr:haloacid dehalogenase [Arcobacteraceae bacterium]MDY0327895.1 haloacid dehalogenase [Arcobacteraceae bacterium]